MIELVKPFQIVIPKNNDTRWEIEEKNSTGKYLAAYQASENIIVKQKLSLSDIQVKSLGQNLGQEALDANIEYSNIQFVLDSSSWTREVLGQERYAIQSELFHVTTSNAFKLKQIPLKADQNLTIWRDTKGFEDTIAEFKQGEKKKISYWQERKHIQLRQKYKKKKLVDFLKLFHKKTVGWQDMMSLKEYLDLYPQEALKIPDLLLRDSSIGSREQSKIIHVLELSGTAPAQDALVQIMTDSQQEAINRSRAIFALSGVRNPTEHAVDNLWQTYKKQTENTSVEQSNMAILALGHISFTQKDKAYLPDQNLSQQLKTRLSTELSNAEDHSNDKAIVLEAMGNARDESLFTEIKPYMTAEGAQVRIAAAHALRHMEDEDSMRLMTEQFVSEEVPQVRDAILQTLLEREPTKNAIATIGKGVLKEKNVRVRQSMIKYLIKNRKKNVSYKQTFAELLKTETSQANRKLLYKGLYSKKDKIIP
ncbi:MAG: HEAT repeat domain-containing protein [Spirochaetota bacterium]